MNKKMALRGRMALRTWTSVLVSGLMALSLAALEISVGPNTAQAATGEEASVNKSLGDLRACLSQEDAILDVYYLIDNSRSMVQIGDASGTDVNGLRFDAVGRSVEQLVNLVDEGTKVNVAAGVFSKSAKTVYEWASLGSNSEEVLGEIGASLIKEPVGGGTNWQVGLELAREEFINQSNQSDSHCQSLVWVTDGGIDIEQDPVKTANGVVALCGLGPTELDLAASQTGLMYQLRSMRIIVIGVLLDAPNTGGENLEDGPQAKRDSKISYLQPVVEGTGTVDTYFFAEESPQFGVFNCGSIAKGATGAKLTIAAADDLANEFQRLVSCITDTCTELSPTPIVQCQLGKCEIPVPQGIRRMEVQVSEDFDQNTVRSPSGASACLSEGVCTLEQGSDTALSILTIEVQNEGGFWTFDESQGSVHPLLFADLGLESDPIKVNPRKPEISTEIRIVQGEGLSYSSDNYRDQKMSAQVIFPDGDKAEAPMELSGGVWTLTWSPEDEQLSLVPSRVIVEFSAKAAGIGTIPDLQLTTITQQFRVEKEKLKEFPTITTPADGETAFFTPIKGLQGQGETVITFKGPESNNGAVCWGSDRVGGVRQTETEIENVPTVSRISGSIQATPSQKVVCPEGFEGLELPQGTEVDINVALVQDEQADAIETGVIDFLLLGPENEKPILESVPFQVETTIVRNTFVQLIALVVLGIVGFGLPYILLLFFVRRQAVFAADLDGSRWASLPVEVGPEGLISIAEISPDKYEFIFMEKGKPSRTIAMGDDTHEAIPPKVWPFHPIRTIVKAPNGQSIYSNHDHSIGPNKSVAASSQVLTDVFYFVADKPTESVQQTLTESDDWGNRIKVDASSDSRDARRISGRLVVILSGFPDLTTSVSTTIGKAQAWPDWGQIYLAETNVEVVPANKTKAPSKAEPTEPAPKPENAQVSDFYFGEPEATSVTPEPNKKSRFSRKPKKENPNSGDSGFSGMPPADDW